MFTPMVWNEFVRQCVESVIVVHVLGMPSDSIKLKFIVMRNYYPHSAINLKRPNTRNTKMANANQDGRITRWRLSYIKTLYLKRKIASEAQLHGHALIDYERVVFL